MGRPRKLNKEEIEYIKKRDTDGGSFIEKVRDFYWKFNQKIVSYSTWRTVVLNKYEGTRPQKDKHRGPREVWEWACEHCTQMTLSELLQLPYRMLGTGWDREVLGGRLEAPPPPEPPPEHGFVWLPMDAWDQKRVADLRRTRPWSYIENAVFIQTGRRVPHADVLRAMAKGTWWPEYRARQVRYLDNAAWKMCREMRPRNVNTMAFTKWWQRKKPTWVR